MSSKKSSSDTLTQTPIFAISFVLKKAWALYKKQWLPYLGVMLFPVLIAIVYMLSIRTLSGVSYAISFVGYFLIQLILGMGIFRITIEVGRGQPVRSQAFVEVIPFIFKYIAGAFLYALVVLGGMLLLVVPGIIWAIKYMFTLYIIVDKGVGPIEALRLSGKITQGIKWDIIGFYAAYVVLVYASIFTLGLGLFIAIPVTYIGSAVLYTLLLQRSKE